MKEKLYLGTSVKDITPKIGANLYGYIPDFPSESIKDNLTLAVFFFRQREKQALMVSVSVCLLETELAKKLREEISEKYKIDKGSIIISATHTHTGPCTASEPGWGDVDREYCEEILRPSLFEGVKEAMENAVPVLLSVSSGESRAGVNRRALGLNNKVNLGQCKWGSYNPEMTVLSFKDENEKIVGNIIHYGCHGTAAGRIPVISRDWIGVMTDALAKETGAITAFFNGPEGDVGPRLSNGDTAGGSMDYVYEIGNIAAGDAVEIFKKQGEYKEAELSVKAGKLNLPVKPRISYEDAIRGIEQFNGAAVNLHGMIFSYYKEVLESYDNGYEETETRETEQTIIKIGDVLFASFPYELFSEIGMRIDEATKDFKVLSLSNTNGSEGYFPTQDQLCRGGYEIEMFKFSHIQPFTDDADFHIVKETLRNMEDLL